jgi:hypothetical protein
VKRNGTPIPEIAGLRIIARAAKTIVKAIALVSTDLSKY